jgi:hypothetical protein
MRWSCLEDPQGTHDEVRRTWRQVPGRVGDGAVAGGAAYADSDFGGCGSTGDGDAHLRFLPCFQAPFLLCCCSVFVLVVIVLVVELVSSICSREF